MRKVFTAGLIGVALVAASFVTTTPAYAGEGGFCVEVLVNAGNTCQHGTYHGQIHNVDGRSTGSAYASVWVANSSGSRISRRGDCVQPGCTARIGDPTAYPCGDGSGFTNVCWAGFAAVHNPGTFLSRYRGYLRFF